MEGACCPTLSVMSHPGFFLSASPPCKTSLRPKNKRLHKAGVWHTGCEVGHRRTTRGTGTQLRGKCFRDWTGDWEKEGQLLQKRPFPQSVLRQNSRPHFDGRSSSGLHTYDDERRHNGFGCRSCSPQASGERITGTPPLLLRMPDPGLHHGASWPCAPAFRVSPVSAQIRTTRKAGGLLWPCKGLLPVRLKTLAFTLFKPSALAALATP